VIADRWLCGWWPYEDGDTARRVTHTDHERFTDGFGRTPPGCGYAQTSVYERNPRAVARLNHFTRPERKAVVRAARQILAWLDWYEDGCAGPAVEPAAVGLDKACPCADDADDATKAAAISRWCDLATAAVYLAEKVLGHPVLIHRERRRLAVKNAHSNAKYNGLRPTTRAGRRRQRP